MPRLTLLPTFVCLLVLSSGCARADRDAPPPDAAFELDELTIPELQDAMASGRYTSRQLVELYLHRIEQIDRNGPTLRSIIETNADALRIADELDEEGSADVDSPD